MGKKTARLVFHQSSWGPSSLPGEGKDCSVVHDHGKQELRGVMRLARVIKMNDNKNLGWDMKPRALELKLISNRDQGIYRGQIILCLPSWGSYTSFKLSDAVQRKALLSG